MNKTMEEWIALYEKKTGEEFKRDERFVLFYLPEKGFAEIMDAGDIIVVNQLCGEIKFWRAFIELLARELGRKTVGTFCIRPIKPYMRLLGFVPYEIKKTPLGDSFFCKDKRTGQKGDAAPIGKDTYCITWEVNANEI